MNAVFMLSRSTQYQIGMRLSSRMQKNKKYDLMKKGRRIIGARKIAGVGTRGCKLNIVHQILGKLVVLSDVTEN